MDRVPRSRKERDYLVFQVPTFQMNPAINAADLEGQRKTG